MCVLTTSALLTARPPSHPADANNKGERRGAEWAVVTGARNKVVVEAPASSSAPSPRCSSRSAPSSLATHSRVTVGPQNRAAASSSSRRATSSSMSYLEHPAHTATAPEASPSARSCSLVFPEDTVESPSCLRTGCRGRALSFHVKKRPPLSSNLRRRQNGG